MKIALAAATAATLGAGGATADLTGGAAGVPTDTYQQTCALPPFEWAAYGTRLTGRMYTRRAAILGDALYAAGYLKSTNAPDKEEFVETDADFGVTGPYTAADPTGASAFWITSDLVSYTTEHGSFAQYEVGVVKINATTGRPEDVFVYYGEGQDETAGLAVKETVLGNTMAVSGHFVGSLSADRADGTTTTIYNSNTNGTADFVQHPNAIKNGFDDGFVLLADADTGDAKWLIAHPTSNKDAQTVGVDLDADGNVYGAGYSCTAPAEGPVDCHAFVAKFAAADGAVVWEKTMPDLAAALWLVHDAEDDALYVTATTTYFGERGDGVEKPAPKENEHCPHDMCAATLRLAAADGAVDWVRTAKGSPRWNFFDQTGDVQLAHDADGPYVYVAIDDVGEDGPVALDEGTPYAGCRTADAVVPEHEVSTAKRVTADDCPDGATFVSRTDAEALPAADAGKGALCGTGHDSVDACIIKYHKYTGLPIWGADIHPVAALVPSVDGKSVMAAGWYSAGSHFDSVPLPDYNGIEGAYNAKLDAETGAGEYVIHSGGVGKTRVYDAVGDADGNLYMVGYTLSAVIDWGGTLQTKIIEEGENQNDDVGTAFQTGKVSSNTNEYQFFAVKLAAATPAPPSCVESCELEGDKVANPVIKAGHCLIDNVCYETGATAEIFGRTCLVCAPDESQIDWSLAATVGELVCFIDNACYDVGDDYTFRESRSKLHTSLCQRCSPKDNAVDWFVDTVNFDFVADFEPPNDCLNKTAATTDSVAVAEGGEKEEGAAPLPTAAPTKPTVPVVSVPVTETLEPPVQSSPDETPPAEVEATDTATPADTTAPIDEAGATDADNAGRGFARGGGAGVVTALVVAIFL